MTSKAFTPRMNASESISSRRGRIGSLGSWSATVAAARRKGAEPRIAVFALLGAMALAPLLPLFFRGELSTLRDEADFFLPIAFHTAKALRAGSLPLWNPRNFAGEPWLAAVQP